MFARAFAWLYARQCTWKCTNVERLFQSCVTWYWLFMLPSLSCLPSISIENLLTIFGGFFFLEKEKKGKRFLPRHFSLSLYRHPFIYTLFSSRFTLIINNKTSVISSSQRKICQRGNEMTTNTTNTTTCISCKVVRYSTQCVRDLDILKFHLFVHHYNVKTDISI